MPQDKPEDPLEIVSIFERCSNYPRTVEGLRAMCEGLEHAAKVTQQPMVEIAKECSYMSNYCPTDHEMLMIGAWLSGGRQRPTR